MEWFNRWFYKQVKKAWENKHRYEEDDCVQDMTGQANVAGPRLRLNSVVGQNHDDSGVLNFKVYSANGGKIVEVLGYDSKRDMDRVNRYVISDDEDFATSLNRIVTMEHLSR